MDPEFVGTMVLVFVASIPLELGNFVHIMVN